ncbi:inter-alpha-trypsin inhibitor heavy chain H3-like isoform X2 [Hyperolius riggenbachi]
MTIDGKTYPGVIKEKEKARKQYETAVSKGQTAGIVRASSGRKTEKFTVSVNVAAKSKVTFELVYEEMLKRRLGKYEMSIKVQPKTLVKDFQIVVDLQEPQGINFLDAEASFITNDLLDTIKKSYTGEKGHVSFQPTIVQQRSCAYCTTTLLNGDFTVTYDVNRDSPGDIQVVNGYFVHFFAPKLDGVPKNVIYVIDRSGSMLGTKMIQTKEALLQILGDTAEQDYFNFIPFSGSGSAWRDTMVKATPTNLAAAGTFVRSIIADGGTNINDPLMSAVRLLDRAHQLKQVPDRSVSFIVLLTDGEANVGESNTARIQENTKRAISGRYTLYCLGFGYGVDYPFLEKMALENSGIARKIYEDSDAKLQLRGFYNEIAKLSLVNVEMEYPANVTSDLTQNSFKNYFDGSEIVVAGRVTDNNLDIFTANVKAEGAKELVNYRENVRLGDAASKQQEYIFGDFTERLWAYLTIQQLLEKVVSAEPSEKEQLKKKALDLSLKYKFVTPLTSMVVTKPKAEEDKARTMVAEKYVEGAGSPPSYGVPTTSNWVPSPPGAASRSLVPSPPGAASRSRAPSPPNFGITTRSWGDGDPHFVITVPQKNDALCFNIQEEPGVVLNLIVDQKLGIAVNGEIIGDKVTNNISSNTSYFGRLGIVNEKVNLRLEVTTDAITILTPHNQTTFSWLDEVTIDREGYNLVLSGLNYLQLCFGEGAAFVVVLHSVWKDHPLHRSYLGLYTVDDQKFSEGVHGLLGQFFHGIDYEVSDVHITADPGRPEAKMTVKSRTLTVIRGVQKDYRDGGKDGLQIPCWFVPNNGDGLIDGNHTDYIVNDVFSNVHPHLLVSPAE